MYQIAFTTVTFRKVSRQEIYQIAEANEVPYIEWGGDVHVPSGDAAAINEIASLSKRYSAKTLSYGSYYKVGTKDYAAFADLIETAKAIGAQTIRIWLGDTGSKRTGEDKIREMVQETRVLADMAEKATLKIAFEFHKNTYNDSAENTAAFLREVGKPNVGSYWQPLGDKNDTENLQKILPFLMGIHVFHWNKRGKRYSLCKGEKQWREWIEIAKKKNSTLPYIIEFVKGDKVKQFEKDVVTLKEMLRDAYPSIN